MLRLTLGLHNRNSFKKSHLNTEPRLHDFEPEAAVDISSGRIFEVWAGPDWRRHSAGPDTKDGRRGSAQLPNTGCVVTEVEVGLSLADWRSWWR